MVDNETTTTGSGGTSVTITTHCGVAQIELNEYGERRKLSLPDFILKASTQWDNARLRLDAAVSVHAHRLVEMEMEHRRIIGIANAQAGEIATQRVLLHNAVVELSNWNVAEQEKKTDDPTQAVGAVDPHATSTGTPTPRDEK